MGEITDLLLSILLEDYRYPLTRRQIWGLRCIPGIDVRSGFLGRPLTDKTKSVKIFVEDTCIAKVTGEGVYTYYHRHGTPALSQLYDRIEQTLKLYTDDGFTKVHDYS